MAELDSLDDELGRQITTRARSQSRALKFVKIVMVLGGTLVSGAAALRIADGKWNEWTAIGACGLAVIFLAGLMDLFTDRDSTADLVLADKAIGVVRSKIADLASFQVFRQHAFRASALFASFASMQKIIRFELNGKGDDVHSANAILSAGGRVLVMALGFDIANHYSICIYKAEKQPNSRVILKCVASLRTLPCEGTPREWEEGEGVTGNCYSSRIEIVVPDMTEPTMKSLFSARGKNRSEDDYRHRSGGAVVIESPSGEPWGVVTVMTDHVGHFYNVPKTGTHPIEGVRALAQTVSLAIAVRESLESRHSGG